jgi:hypothetical protein
VSVAMHERLVVRLVPSVTSTTTSVTPCARRVTPRTLSLSLAHTHTHSRLACYAIRERLESARVTRSH